MANISAIRGLLSASSSPSTTAATDSTSGFDGSDGVIRGAYPYPFFKEFPEYADPQLMKVLCEIESDPKWGPVFRGDLTTYSHDHSRADLAFCGELMRRGLSVSLTDLGMRASALYREKWERHDYRASTLQKAQGPQPTATTPASDTAVKTVLDLRQARLSVNSAAPPPRDWFYSGMLVPGKSAILAGFGGVSKTQLAIQLAIATALGQPFAGRSLKHGSVMLICGEEDRAELTRRVNAVVRYEKLSTSQMAAVETRIFAFPMEGEDIRLTRKQQYGEIVATAFGQSIKDAAEQISDLRLIVIDHAALLHGGEFNSKEDVTLTMRAINNIAKDTGAAVLVLAHAPKSASSQEESDANMVAGSTAFVDQARAAWVLSKMRPGEAKDFKIGDERRRNYVSLKVVKSNYGPSEEVFWFERHSFDDVGLLEHVQLAPPPTATDIAEALRKSIEGLVRAQPGTCSRTAFREKYSGKRGPLGASKADVDRAIDDLLIEGKLILRPPTDAERSTHGLSGQVKAVLDVKI